MNALVTGGAGFIGSNLVDELLARGHTVRVLDNFSTGKRENLGSVLDRIDLIEGDIRSYHLVQQAVEGVEVVFHQAALPSVPRSINDPITSNEVNVGGTLNVLEASRMAGVQRVVYASSSSVYGDRPELPKHEGMAPNPLSPYAVSKLTGEHYCRVYARIYGLTTVALRYFNVFGPRQDPNSQYSAVIPRFVSLIRQGRPPTIFGDGEQSRDFTYVTNVVRANLLAATADCEGGLVLNCACGERTTLNEIVRLVGRYAERSVEPIYAEPRVGDVRHSVAAVELAREKIGYEATVSLEEGLSRIVSGDEASTTVPEQVPQRV
ncbi:MAG: SDR family oxidoreductase [Rubricoccaceae bacterium]|nr:SDR family oxidoreductase [Rubricoccaceae bacterium]